MTKIKVKLVKSSINCTQRQKRTLEALGLRKLNRVVEHNETAQIKGMINKVNHLVTIEN